MSAGRLNAEDRRYEISSTTDVVAGGSRGQGVAGITFTSASTPPGSFYYEIYPSVEMRSQTAHSTLEVSYAYGLSDLSSFSYHTNSHSVSATLAGALGANWKLTLSDSFQRASNFLTF